MLVDYAVTPHWTTSREDGEDLTTGEITQFCGTVRESCRYCRHWNEDDLPYWVWVGDNSEHICVVSWDGQCRRHSPVLLQLNPNGRDFGSWPITHFDDACGDFVQSTDPARYPTDTTPAASASTSHDKPDTSNSG